MNGSSEGCFELVTRLAEPEAGPQTTVCAFKRAFAVVEGSFYERRGAVLPANLDAESRLHAV